MNREYLVKPILYFPGFFLGLLLMWIGLLIYWPIVLVGISVFIYLAIRFNDRHTHVEYDDKGTPESWRIGFEEYIKKVGEKTNEDEI